MIAFADDTYKLATCKLCQVSRLPMWAYRWSKDEKWGWTYFLKSKRKFKSIKHDYIDLMLLAY